MVDRKMIRKYIVAYECGNFGEYIRGGRIRADPGVRYPAISSFHIFTLTYTLQGIYNGDV